MAITLVTVIGGSASDSLVSAAEFDTFLSRRRGATTVLAMTADEKAQGLLEAMSLLEAESWRGARVTSTQALSHPRTGLPKRDGVGGYLDGSFYSDGYYLTTEIAAPVKQAQNELAFLILAAKYNADDSLKAPVVSISMDDLKKDYGRGGSTSAQRGDLPPTVVKLLSGLLRGNELQLA